MKNTALLISAAAALLTPGSAFAETTDWFVDTTGSPTNATGVLTAVDTIANWMFNGFLIIAVIFILVAAFHFLTSSGNTEKTSAAKKMLLYAIIAVVIAVSAKGIVKVAAKLVGADVTFPGEKK